MGHCAATAVMEDIIANNGGAYPGMVIPRMIAEGYTVLAVPSIHYRNILRPDTFVDITGIMNCSLKVDSFIPWSFSSPFLACWIFWAAVITGRSSCMVYLARLGAASVYPALDSSIPRFISSSPDPGHGVGISIIPMEMMNRPIRRLHIYWIITICIPCPACLLPANGADQPTGTTPVASTDRPLISFMDSAKAAGQQWRWLSFLPGWIQQRAHGIIQSPYDIIFSWGMKGQAFRRFEDTLTSGNDYCFNIQEAFNASPSSRVILNTYSCWKLPAGLTWTIRPASYPATYRSTGYFRPWQHQF